MQQEPGEIVIQKLAAMSNFVLMKFFKQPPESFNPTIIVYTPKDRLGCGLTMKLNDRWQIWATYTTMFSDDGTPRWPTVDSGGRSSKFYDRNIS